MKRFEYPKGFILNKKMKYREHYTMESITIRPTIIQHLRERGGLSSLRINLNTTKMKTLVSHSPNYKRMSVEELYEIARKKGIRHNDSMDKDELIDRIIKFENDSRHFPPEQNRYSVKNPASAPQGKEDTIEGI